MEKNILVYVCNRKKLTHIADGKTLLSNCHNVNRIRSCEAMLIPTNQQNHYIAHRIIDAVQNPDGLLLSLANPQPVYASNICSGGGYRRASVAVNWTVRTPAEMRQHVKSWENWDNRYQSNRANFGNHPHPALLHWLQDIPKNALDNVLVLGDGPGRNGLHISKFAQQVISTELSHFSTPLRTPSNNHQWIYGDALRWLDSRPQNLQFSAIVAIHSRQDPDNETKTVQAALRHTTPGTHVLVVAYKGAASHQQIHKEWTPLKFTQINSNQEENLWLKACVNF